MRNFVKANLETIQQHDLHTQDQRPQKIALNHTD